MTIQARSSLEPPLDYNQDQRLWEIKVHYDLSKHFES